MLISRKGIIFILVLSFVFAVNFNARANYLGWRLYNWFHSNEPETSEVEEKTPAAAPAAPAAPAAEEKAEEKVEEVEEEEIEADSKYEIDFGALGHNLLYYLPNCLLDLADCFTFEVGAGDYGVDLYLTRYANIGIGVGYSYNLGWTHRRQIGIFNDASYNADLLCLSTFEKNRRNIIGTYNNLHVFNYTNADIIKCPQTLVHEDPFAIGAKAACLIGVKFQFHPIELADFITGLFFYDLCDDSNQQQVVRVHE